MTCLVDSRVDLSQEPHRMKQTMPATETHQQNSGMAAMMMMMTGVGRADASFDQEGQSGLLQECYHEVDDDDYVLA